MGRWAQMTNEMCESQEWCLKIASKNEQKRMCFKCFKLDSPYTDQIPGPMFVKH